MSAAGVLCLALAVVRAEGRLLIASAGELAIAAIYIAAAKHGKPL